MDKASAIHFFLQHINMSNAREMENQKETKNLERVIERHEKAR